MNNFQRISAGFDPYPAMQDLREQPELWNLFTLRQAFEGSAHHDTECIVLRGPNSVTMQSAFTELTADWLPYCAQLPGISGAVMGAIDALGPLDALGRIMVVSLKAGGKIDQHSDEGEYAEYYDRFHLVIESQPGNWFTCGAESIRMRVGELWKFDHRQLHSVANLSSAPRIHIIIDARRKPGKESPWQ